MPWWVRPGSAYVKQVHFMPINEPEGWTHPQVPVDERHWPMRFRQYEGEDSFRDVMQSYDQPIVSCAVRDLIEEFEPGRQQFVPVELERHTGEVVPAGEYYLLKVMQRVDAIAAEQSEVVPMISRRSGEIYAYSYAQEAVFKFRRAVAGALHVWCDEYANTELFCSDALVAAMEARNMGAFKKVRAYLVDA